MDQPDPGLRDVDEARDKYVELLGGERDWKKKEVAAAIRAARSEALRSILEKVRPRIRASLAGRGANARALFVVEDTWTERHREWEAAMRRPRDSSVPEYEPGRMDVRGARLNPYSQPIPGDFCAPDAEAPLTFRITLSTWLPDVSLRAARELGVDPVHLQEIGCRGPSDTLEVTGCHDEVELIAGIASEHAIRYLSDPPGELHREKVWAGRSLDVIRAWQDWRRLWRRFQQNQRTVRDVMLS